MKKYNICTGRAYKDRDGNDKKAWRTVGQLTRWEATQDKPESFSLEMYMWPDTRYSVFEEKPREAQAPQDDF